jgi:ABC-2 type transport system permease protein
MFNVNDLWTERSKRTGKELGRYMRYIFNGHLIIVLLFLIGTLAYFYQEWVKGLDESFPAALIIGVLLGIFLTYSPVYTFFLEADRVFLIPLESKLSSYFLRSGTISFLFQGYILLMILAALMPLYVQVSGSSFRSFFYFLLVLLILKVWNLATRWRIQYYVEKSAHIADSLVRFCLNTVFLYLLFSDAPIYLLVILATVMLGVYYYFAYTAKQKGLKWEDLIMLEQKRLMHFYRIANLFTDVPKLKDVVKRRKWLDWLTYKIPFQQSHSHLFLLTRTFIRSGDYLGLVIRLSVIAGIVIFYWDFIYGQLIFLILFQYLTAFQLLPLKNHHQNTLWVELYPIVNQQREQAFKKILALVLLFQGILLNSVFLVKGDYGIALIGCSLSLIFSFFFVRYYTLKKR